MFGQCGRDHVRVPLGRWKFLFRVGLDADQHHCFSGVSACVLALGAYMCGNDQVAVYDGAWTEWFQKASPEEMSNVPEE